MKIKKGKDLDYVRAVRERFPDLPLMVDANGDYRLDDAAHLAGLDAFGLTMIEQPLSYSDIWQHSILQKSLKTPLCLDESIHSLDDAAAAIALGGCRILNLKQGRVGGILESMRILEHAAAHGIPVWSGGMDETGIGRAVNIHLQTLDGFTLAGGHVRDEPLLPRGPRRTPGRPRRRGIHRRAGRAGFRRARRRGTARAAEDLGREDLLREEERREDFYESKRGGKRERHVRSSADRPLRLLRGRGARAGTALFTF